jgi:hypothetical protein
MKVTFERLRQYMEDNLLNSFIPGRGTQFEVANTVEIGMVKLTANIEEMQKAQVSRASRAESMKAQAEDMRQHQAESLSQIDLNIVDETHTEHDNKDKDPEDEDQDVRDDGTLFVDD